MSVLPFYFLGLIYWWNSQGTGIQVGVGGGAAVVFILLIVCCCKCCCGCCRNGNQGGQVVTVQSQPNPNNVNIVQNTMTMVAPNAGPTYPPQYQKFDNQY